MGQSWNHVKSCQASNSRGEGLCVSGVTKKTLHDREFSIDESKPYAELWMGTHPKSPAVLSSTGERLADHISANPESELGKHVTEKFGSNLPFLLKILSVNQALSIQGN